MAYGTIKVDQVTFTNGGVDQTVSVSGLVQAISGDITSTGTIQGATIIGTSTISGTTVTGNTGQFITATAATGIFTSTLSGVTITGNTASFTTITGGTVTLTSGVFASGTAAAPSVSIGTTDNGLYSPGADQVAISTSGSERIRIGADGEIGIAGANYGTSGQVLTSAGSGAAPTWTTPSAGNTNKIEEGNTSAEVIDTGSDGRFVVTTEGSERARVDSSGRLLIGTSTARANTFNSGIAPQIQLEGTTGANSTLSIVSNRDNIGQPFLLLGKSRGTSAGDSTVVQSGDIAGTITFQAADGTELVETARIDAYIDGTPGADDMPGRLVFSTTADGAISPTERMRIDNAGRVGFNFSTLGGGSGQYRFAGSITGAVSCNGLLYTPTIQPDVTTAVAIFSSQVSTAANGGTPYTVGNIIHYSPSQAAFDADSTVTNQIAYSAPVGLTGATNNFGFYGAISNAANRWNFYAQGTAPNYFAGKIASLGSYNDTTASAANVFIASNGDIKRSTSSIRYKTDIETLEQSYADNVILNARPVWYRSLCEADNAGWSYYGLIAEEVAELDPRLVFWGRPTKEVLQEEAKDAVLDDEGNVIEPATEAVYTNVEDTDAELRPEGVQYDRLTVMLIDVVQRQQKAIEALEAKVAALGAS